MAQSLHECNKPILFVDIDGVVSLWGFPPDDPPTGCLAMVDGIPHFLSAGAAGHLRQLQDTFDLVWCSGWEEKANEHLPHLLGLGPFPLVSFDRAPGERGAHWKLNGIDAYARDRPAAWVDDAFTAACHHWAGDRAAPTHLETTDPATGLTAGVAQRLRAWAHRIA